MWFWLNWDFLRGGPRVFDSEFFRFDCFGFTVHLNGHLSGFLGTDGELGYLAIFPPDVHLMSAPDAHTGDFTFGPGIR